MTTFGRYPRPRVGLVSGFWGQNIGNAFFNIGGKWILEKIVGVGNVASIQDQQGYWTIHDQSNGNPAKEIELLRYLGVDYVVLEGPSLAAGYAQLWRPTFQAPAARGTKILLIGAALFKFNDRECAIATAERGWLRAPRWPPLSPGPVASDPITAGMPSEVAPCRS